MRPVPGPRSSCEGLRVAGIISGGETLIMLKLLTAMAAVAALCLQPAVAAGLGGSLMASETGEQAKAKKEHRGVIAFVMDQVRFSFTAIAGQNADASKADSQYHYSYSQDGCPDAAEQPAAADEAEKTDAKKAEPVGPEPIYFGF